jgi:hypothetical protein
VYFDKVIGYCKNEDTVRLFSPKWMEALVEPEPIKEQGKRKIVWKE